MAIGEAAFGRLWALSPAKEADWDALYAQQLPRVYNYFRYQLGNDAVAEDLTSRTFEKAWTARHRYRRDLASFTTWLMTIARNTAVDHYRSRRVHAPLEHAQHISSGETPEHHAERRSDLEQLSRLLGTLPEREREIIALKYGSELTNREIARQMHLSESNVGTILHRTVLTLRAGFQEGES
jgi:RNA polymerase sigma-70 factor (ECF subfamily)